MLQSTSLRCGLSARPFSAVPAGKICSFVFPRCSLQSASAPLTQPQGSRGSSWSCKASKGFGSSSSTETKGGQQGAGDAPSAPSPTSTSAESEVDALEARIRSRRTKRVEAKVIVESAAVDAVTGKGPAPPTARAESAYVLSLFFLFGVILLEGLIIGGSGFLPEDWDAFITDVLYPGYTPTVLSFLGASSLYGLWKTGKVNLPFMGGPAPPMKE